MLPKQPLKIRRYGEGFQLTTEDGTRYQFLAKEFTMPNAQNHGPNPAHNSAWHLSRLISADKADTISFQYTLLAEAMPRACTMSTGQYYVGTYQEGRPDVSQYGPGYACGSPADYSFHNVTPYVTTIRVQYLKAIMTRGASILIERNASRELARIRVLSHSDSTREIRRFTFYTSHYLTPYSSTDYRLRLDSLQESAGGLARPPYRFSYLGGDQPLRTRMSAAQDYWGYANAATINGDFNTTLNPTLLADPRLNQGYRRAADRRPDFVSAARGAIETVRYPTGGTTLWEYEPGRLNPEEAGDIEPQYQEDSVSTGYSSATAHHIPGGPRLPATSSRVLTFVVPPVADSAEVVLYRLPSDSTRTTGGTNTYRDFNIWRFSTTPGVDSLVTNSTAPNAYRILDGQGDTRTYRMRLSPGTYRAQVYCEIHEAHSSLTIRVAFRDSAQIKLGLLGPGIRVRRTTTTAATASGAHLPL